MALKLFIFISLFTLAAQAEPKKQRIFFRTTTESFNENYFFALDGGKLWLRPRGPDPQRWVEFQDPPSAQGPIVEISADDEYVIAIDSARNIHTMFRAHLDSSNFFWIKDWGQPGFSPRKGSVWSGPGMTLTPAHLGWSVSFLSPRLDRYFWDPRVPNREYYIGLGVTTLFYLNPDKHRVTYLDPWLPPDNSREVCGPHRNRFQAESMSASGSTLFVIGRNGDMYTRTWDFDIGGGDDIFFNYSYEDQSRVLRWMHFLRLVGSKISPVSRQLPAPPWMAQPRITGGEITSRITIVKKGEGAKARDLRVEGMKDGRPGFFTKEMYSSGPWKFFAYDSQRDGVIALKPFLVQNSQPSLGELNEEASFSAVIEGIQIEVSDFHPYCTPSRIVLRGYDKQPFELILHSTEEYRKGFREGRGLTKEPEEYESNIEIPEQTRNKMSNSSHPVTKFIKKYFGSARFNWIQVFGTVAELRIGNVTLSSKGK